MKKKDLIFLGFLLLSACSLTNYDDLAEQYIKSEGKQTAAQALENAEWYICRASPIGSIKDRYLGTKKWQGYLLLCEINPADVSP